MSLLAFLRHLTLSCLCTKLTCASDQQRLEVLPLAFDNIRLVSLVVRSLGHYLHVGQLCLPLVAVIRQLVLDMVGDAMWLADWMVGRLVFGYANSLLLNLERFFARIDDLSTSNSRESTFLSKVRLA